MLFSLGTCITAQSYSKICYENTSLRKHPFLPALLGTFRAEERLRLSDRNSILITQINVYIINPVGMGFQI